jgi:hypothetical protein
MFCTICNIDEQGGGLIPMADKLLASLAALTMTASHPIISHLVSASS